MAQCVARAPGGPTHVLLDDRIAEHVPGCNMAFRRDALLAIGGFNPVYLRAGDDVDVCWRLQARGWRIGFAPAALVWHHHREPEGLLAAAGGLRRGRGLAEAHHPEKFAGGHDDVARPDLQPAALRARPDRHKRVNTGVWGTAAFPSVYRTDPEGLTYVPHTQRWLVTSVALMLAGLAALPLSMSAILVVLLGACGVGVTIAKCVGYALGTDLGGVPPVGILSPRLSRLVYRTTIAFLHFVQPIARLRGRIRGWLNTPEVLATPDFAGPDRNSPAPSLRELVRGTAVLMRTERQERFWSERWVDRVTLLTHLTCRLRHLCGWSAVDIDEGWRGDRDMSVRAGRTMRIDVRTLVEEHADGKCLLRVTLHTRPTLFGWMLAFLAPVSLAAVTLAGADVDWPAVSLAVVGCSVAILVVTMWRTIRRAAIVERAIGQLTSSHGMELITSPRRAFGGSSVLMRPALRAAAVSALIGVTVWSAASVSRNSLTHLGREIAAPLATPLRTVEAIVQAPGGLALAPNGDLYVSDPHDDVIERIDQRGVITTVVGSARVQTAPDAGFDTPGGVVIAANGDLIIADSHNHRVCRVDRLTGAISTIVGSGVAGFSGDGGPATAAELNNPSAVALAADGDLFIADTINNRIRVVDHRTGIIRTIAGGRDDSDIAIIESSEVGDGGPAIAARLFWPSDIALTADGALYVADTRHNRVRRVDTKGTISTVAGNGSFGSFGDGGPAIAASLAGPAGIALAPDPGGTTLFIADFYNGRVRVVRPDGVIATLPGSVARPFGTPSRIAYNPRGWLYVTDASRHGVTAMAIPPSVARSQRPPRASGARVEKARLKS